MDIMGLFIWCLGLLGVAAIFIFFYLEVPWSIKRGLAGGHIDGDAAWEETLEGSKGADENGLDVGGVGDDGEDNIGVGSDFQRGGSVADTHVKERLDLGLGAVEDGEGVASLDEMGAHGLPHHSLSDPSQPCVSRADWFQGGDSGGHGIEMTEVERERRDDEGG
ncbi:hypothetical protein NE237_009239 [Protea cynaroides]|uniref:Uncharacterized protein n=1 Tax=Protea cynaroides TaxID=273540 RepID=A0A9Q0KY66_9MAGN|nr:hypothetical protein NE237_009239 [Protea cynaroides]